MNVLKKKIFSLTKFNKQTKLFILLFIFHITLKKKKK